MACSNLYVCDSLNINTWKKGEEERDKGINHNDSNSLLPG